MISFFKLLIAKIKAKIQQRYEQKMIKEISENMTPVSGMIIYLEQFKKGKFKYKILVKAGANKTVMLKVKNKIRLKQGDRVHGYYDKDRIALIEVA
ncbi:hypothetical protein Dred_1380 [Desulforamulus reducens MI-1]|uniref:Uncharacterized protein n=1 Tax=Desulforamulus reducens (strain ATCC BAA-1160 / DSM 100696 / MI-1) TaxID=349161 RepID=A4J4A7_DESRM|nr:hypothetical protein [Desulforamulus reducens]ABO49910.1 hypothetical protein Dred_1380 [Desulforamulus reducens MI-1]